MTKDNILWCIKIAAILAIVVVVGAGVWMISVESASAIQSQKDNATAISWNARTVTWNLASATSKLDSVLGELADKRTGIARTLRNVNTLTAQIGRTSNTLRLAAVDGRKEQEQASAKILASMDSLKGMVDETNARLNGDNGTLQALAGDLNKLEVVIKTLGSDSAGLVTAGTATMVAAGDVLRDPNISKAMASLAGASAHVDHGMGEFDETLGYVRDSFKPQKTPFWRGILSTAIAQALGLPLRYFPQRVQVTGSVPIPITTEKPK